MRKGWKGFNCPDCERCVMVVHLLPVIESPTEWRIEPGHERSMDCSCEPVMERLPGGEIVVHNAFGPGWDDSAAN